MWAQIRFIPDIQLVQFRPIALIFTSLDCYSLDWVVFTLVFLLSFPMYSIFRWAFLLYVSQLRLVNTESTTHLWGGSFLIQVTLITATPTLLVLTTWGGPLLTFFSAHLILSDALIKLAPLLLVTSLLTMVTVLNLNPYQIRTVSVLLMVTLVFVPFLFLVVFLLSMSTCFFVFVFSLEFFNLAIFATYISVIAFTYNNRCTLKSNFLNFSDLNPLIIFFWINALSSLFLFALLIFYSVEDILPSLLYNSWEINRGSMINSNFIQTKGIVLFALLTVLFLFKLGVPPFISWKLRLFDSAPILFIFLYNIPYSVYLLFLFIFITQFILLTSSTLIGVFLLVGGFLSLLWTILTLNNVFTFASFLAYSTALTTVLLWLFSYWLGLDLTFNFYLIFFYLGTYALTLYSFFTAIGNGASSASFPLSLDAFYLGGTRTYLSQIWTVIVYFILFSSFAGLPLITSFYLKLSLVTLTLMHVNQPALFVIFLFLMLFISVIFYFRFARFFLTRATNSAAGAPATYLKRRLVSNLTSYPNAIRWVLLACLLFLAVGWFFFADLVFLIH